MWDWDLNLGLSFAISANQGEFRENSVEEMDKILYFHNGIFHNLFSPLF